MQTIKLNLIPGAVMPVVHVSQYDTNRQFAIEVYEGAATYSLTGKDVQIRGTKPDGNGFAYDAEDGVVSVSGYTVTINTTQQMTAVGGQTMAELRITSGTTILGTLNFVLDVEHSALSDDTPISGTEIPVIERQLEEIVDELEGYAEDAEAWAAGTRDGSPVPASDPAYHNNSKYYKDEASNAATTATTKAGEAATSATNAGNSATTAYNAATAAINKADEASTSATNAGNSATAAAADSLEAEGWAVGEQGGTPVGPTSPYYHNNAKYYSEQAGVTSLASMSDVELTSPTNNQVLKYDADSQKWVNGTGGGGGADALDDLTDVTLTTPAAGELLQFDGAKWENSATIPQKVAGLQETGCVNVADFTNITSQVVNGVTWTVFSDFTVEANGTPTEGNASTVFITIPEGKRINLVPGKYKSVGCPPGGSESTYRTMLNIDGAYTAAEYGDGLILNRSGEVRQITLSIRPGYTANHVLFKPMLTPDLSATYADYQPHAMTNRELTEAVTGNTFGTFVDATSLLPYTIPSDGYITAGAKGSSSYMYARIKDANNVDGPECYAIGAGTDTWMQSSVFVRKGMIVYSTGMSGTGRVRFYPINN